MIMDHRDAHTVTRAPFQTCVRTVGGCGIGCVLVGTAAKIRFRAESPYSAQLSKLNDNSQEKARADAAVRIWP